MGWITHYIVVISLVFSMLLWTVLLNFCHLKKHPAFLFNTTECIIYLSGEAVKVKKLGMKLGDKAAGIGMSILLNNCLNQDF